MCNCSLPYLGKIYGVGTNEKDLSEASFSHLVEHLEKSSSLIFDELARWRILIWEDYLGYQTEQKRRKKIVVP
jgi:hypothetical protein